MKYVLLDAQSFIVYDAALSVVSRFAFRLYKNKWRIQGTKTG